uniref:Pr1-like protein n=1 Tax=Oryza sativa subsp. japonica TaxID=39947 RepID=Q6ZAZ6_ORYSJ|nr:pr1-like protein [Oryza sativa Japonica Group]
MSILLHFIFILYKKEHGCDHIKDFPELLKGAWLENSQCSGAALRAFQKDFWEDGGKDCTKTRLREQLEKLTKDKEAAATNPRVDPRPSEPSDEDRDHPEPRGGVRGSGPRKWGPRSSLTVHGGPGAPGLTPASAVGPTRQPHLRARAADGRAPHGGHTARPKAATSARPARRSGGRERGREGGKEEAVLGSPQETAVTEEAAGAEKGGGVARVDGDGGVPAVGELDEAVDGVGGEGSDAEVGGGTADLAAAAALGAGRGGGSGGRRGMMGGSRPSARVADGPTHQRRSRGEGGGGRVGRGERRDGGGSWAGFDPREGKGF